MMKNLSRYKTFIFDLDGTLYDYEVCDKYAYKAVRNWIARHYKTDIIEADRAIRSGRNNSKILSTQNGFIKQTASYHNRILYFQQVAEFFTSKNAVKDSLRMFDIYNKAFYKKMKPFDWVNKFFKNKLFSQFQIGICTNMVAEIQFKKLKRLGIDKYINFIVTSEEAGVEKPDPWIYKIAINKSKCSADEILFIGDEYEKDVEGPKSAGMDADIINYFLREVGDYEYCNR